MPTNRDPPDAAHSEGNSEHGSPNSPGVIVPSYPFDTAHQYQPSSAHGIHALLGAHGAKPLMDDSEVDTKLPSVQVDYLSHDWDEPDVWESWKAMKRHKRDLVDGARLENASWRTWAQQRNNLEKVDPASLNWMKDSDVTWLYGPLHESQDLPVSTKKEATTHDRLGLDVAQSPKNTSRQPPENEKDSQRESKSPKPRAGILKHRTLSDLLTDRSASSPQNIYPHGSPVSSESGAPQMQRSVSHAAHGDSDSSEGSNSSTADTDRRPSDSPKPKLEKRHISFALPESA